MPVYKDKKRSTWFYDFRKVIDGVTYSKRKRGFTSKTEALLEEQKAIERLKNNEQEQKAMTLDQLAALFFEYQESKLKPTTIDMNKRMYSVHVGAVFGDCLASSIINKDLYEWKRKFLKKGYSESFANKVLGTFKQIIQFGIKKGYIKNNTLPDELEKVHLNKLVPERQVLTLDQINQFLDTFIKDDPTEYLYWLYFYTFANTGMRPNEFRCLQVKDIQGNYLIVNKSVTSKLTGQGIVIQTPKTNTSIRRVLMPPEIIQLLKDYTKNDCADDFIFGKEKVFSETTLLRKLKQHLDAAGLPHIVLYGFRHSHATNLIKAGVPIKVVAQRLGHKNASTTMNVYWHLFQDDEQQVLSVLKRQK